MEERHSRTATCFDPNGVPRLPAAEIEVLASLWRCGDSTVRRIREDMDGFRPMTQGAMTSLVRRLEGKGLVRRSGAPKAQTHTSLGQRPREGAFTHKRAESPPHRTDVIHHGHHGAGFQPFIVWYLRCPGPLARAGMRPHLRCSRMPTALQDTFPTREHLLPTDKPDTVGGNPQN